MILLRCCSLTVAAFEAQKAALPAPAWLDGQANAPLKRDDRIESFRPGSGE